MFNIRYSEPCGLALLSDQALKVTNKNCGRDWIVSLLHHSVIFGRGHVMIIILPRKIRFDKSGTYLESE